MELNRSSASTLAGRPRVTHSDAAFLAVTEIERQRANRGKLYQEFLRAPALSAGPYMLPAGATAT